MERDEAIQGVRAETYEYVLPMGDSRDVKRFSAELSTIKIVDGSGRPFDWEGVKGSYTVLISGSLSCQIFVSRIAEVRALYERFAPRGVKFFLVYLEEAHPDGEKWTTTVRLEERLDRVGAAVKELSTGEIPWLCDNSVGDMQSALGGSPTADAILDKNGKMILRHDWLAPTDLHYELERLLEEDERTK